MELHRFESDNFSAGSLNFIDSVSPEALNLTELELNTWKLHDKKLPHTLMTAMAKLYTEIYPISKEDAFEILEPWISAVWWHDVAETAEEGGRRRGPAGVDGEGVRLALRRVLQRELPEADRHEHREGSSTGTPWWARNRCTCCHSRGRTDPPRGF